MFERQNPRRPGSWCYSATVLLLRENSVKQQERQIFSYAATTQTTVTAAYATSHCFAEPMPCKTVRRTDTCSLPFGDTVSTIAELEERPNRFRPWACVGMRYTVYGIRYTVYSIQYVYSILLLYTEYTAHRQYQYQYKYSIRLSIPRIKLCAC